MGNEIKIDENISAYSSFFEETVAGFAAINEIFERMAEKADSVMETYGGLGENGAADEAENAQLSQLRILARDFNSFLARFVVSIGALRDDLVSKIEFAEAMLEAIDALDKKTAAKDSPSEDCY